MYTCIAQAAEAAKAAADAASSDVLLQERPAAMDASKCHNLMMMLSPISLANPDAITCRLSAPAAAAAAILPDGTPNRNCQLCQMRLSVVLPGDVIMACLRCNDELEGIQNTPGGAADLNFCSVELGGWLTQCHNTLFQSLTAGRPQKTVWLHSNY